MGTKASVVQINSNRYDAATGQVIDGVKRISRRVRSTSATIASHSKAAAKAKPETKTPISARSQKAARELHRRSQHSQTLIRRIVSRPARSMQTAKTQVAAKKTPEPKVDANRLDRAKAVAKHDKVRRFGDPIASGVKSIANSVLPVNPKVRYRQDDPAPSATANVKPMPSMVVASASHQRLERLLDNALARADAHKQAVARQQRSLWRRLHRRSRWILAALIISALGATAFLVWKYVPQASFRVAASRAHIDAQLPAYTPQGYKYSGVKSGDGVVTVQYSKVDDSSQSYSVTAKSNSSLLNSPAPQGAPTQTIKEPNGASVTAYQQGSQGNAQVKCGDVVDKVTGSIPPSEAGKVASSTCQ